MSPFPAPSSKSRYSYGTTLWSKAPSSSFDSNFCCSPPLPSPLLQQFDFLFLINYFGDQFTLWIKQRNDINCQPEPNFYAHCINRSQNPSPKVWDMGHNLGVLYSEGRIQTLHAFTSALEEFLCRTVVLLPSGEYCPRRSQPEQMHILVDHVLRRKRPRRLLDLIGLLPERLVVPARVKARVSWTRWTHLRIGPRQCYFTAWHNGCSNWHWVKLLWTYSEPK